MAPCEEDVCLSDGAFLLQRPIGSVGRNTIDVSSRFGEYQRNVKEAMHGVKFLNTTGIPVLAAADGVVVIAGDDLTASYGPSRDSYGNLVILRHDIPGLGQPVFTLYGQLSEVSVQVDDPVAAGDEIGKVGNTGRVRGSTLSFEVRLGDNNYGAACNPELWLSTLPYEGGALTGAIAGRIQDADGNLIHPVDLQFELLGSPGQPALETYYLKTYSDRRLSEASPWKENFAIADLPPGRYQISFFLKGFQQREIEVVPGKLTLVNFTIP
jgi:murein DD-endopeptidase MepM/ murein hydrolase activator NlpD